MPPQTRLMPPAKKGALPFHELVALTAMLMAVGAIGIDAMLPAMPDIARELGLATANQRQWIISVYMLGIGVSQIAYGPVADRFGRRIPVITCLLLFAVTSVMVSITSSFSAMLIARFLQGGAAAGARVISLAIVRDRFEGREMARVISLAFLVFLAVPMIAPSLGALVMMFGPWRAIFYVLAGYAALLAAWIAVRVPETLNPAQRRTIRPRQTLAAFWRVLSNRASLWNTLALTMSFGPIVGFVNSAQQIYAGPLTGEARWFPLYFAGVAFGTVMASLLNSQIVLRIGTRKVSHGAAILFILVALAHLACRGLWGESLWLFAGFQCASMFCTALMYSNFGAMAMEEMGDIAATAAAVQGTLSMVVAVLIGFVIGQAFNGTSLPLILGTLACSLATMAATLCAERGRLFHSHHHNDAGLGQGVSG